MTASVSSNIRSFFERMVARRPGDLPEQLSLTPESLAKCNPRLYLALMMLFTLLGQLLSLGFPLIALTLIAGLAGSFGPMPSAMGWLGLVAHIGMMVGAGLMTVFLWRQKIPLPLGRPLTAEERLPLDWLMRLQVETPLSRPKEVRITEAHQLTLTSVPRNGFALFNRRVLLLGLPTLQALTKDQAKIAVAHALCRPNTLKGWLLRAIALQSECSHQHHAVYRIQSTIGARIMTALLTPFLSVYKSWSQPALRWNVLERDSLLNQSIGVDNLLECLAADALVRRYLEEMFWPAIAETTKRDAQPPHPHALFDRMLRKQLTQKVSSQWIAEAMHETPSEGDSDPTLSERLAKLGARRLEPPNLGGENAAEALLRESRGSVIEELDKIWRRRMLPHWQSEYSKHAEYRERLTVLRRRAVTEGIHGPDAIELARLAKHFLSPEEAISVYRQIAKMNPHDATILTGVGRQLSALGLDEGARLLRRAVRLRAPSIAEDRDGLASLSISDQMDSDMESAGSSPNERRNRSGEHGNVPFRSERICQENGQWYFHTREGALVGPFKDMAETRKALAAFIAEMMHESRTEKISSSDPTIGNGEEFRHMVEELLEYFRSRNKSGETAALAWARMRIEQLEDNREGSSGQRERIDVLQYAMNQYERPAYR